MRRYNLRSYARLDRAAGNCAHSDGDDKPLLEKAPSTVKNDKVLPGKSTQRIPAAMRRVVWCKHFGEDLFPCYCCGIASISPFQFHCGHVVPRSKGGKAEVSNLRPICQSCNSSMGTENLYDFKERLTSSS